MISFLSNLYCLLCLEPYLTQLHLYPIYYKKYLFLWFSYQFHNFFDLVNSRSSWENSLSVYKFACFSQIIPRMQPTDHMSTAFVYFLEPRRISGALYHLVATYSVITGYYSILLLYSWTVIYIINLVEK